MSIRIPTIDEEQQRLLQSCHPPGPGRELCQRHQNRRGRILNDLKDAGPTGHGRAEGGCRGWRCKPGPTEEAINARKLIARRHQNPSWAITGRSGRKAQSSAAQDAARTAASRTTTKTSQTGITAPRGELKKLRPKEVIGKESFNYAWGKAKGMIADSRQRPEQRAAQSAGQSAQEHELPSWPATCNPGQDRRTQLDWRP